MGGRGDCSGNRGDKPAECAERTCDRPLRTGSCHKVGVEM